MKRHKKKSKTGQTIKSVLGYYLMSAGVCAIVYLFINQNAPISRIVEITFLLGLPVMLILLMLQKIFRKALQNSPLVKGEQSGW